MPPVAQRQPQRPHHRPPVHPAVLEEAMVLARQGGGDRQRRDRDPAAPRPPGRRPPAAAPAAAGPARSVSSQRLARWPATSRALGIGRQPQPGGDRRCTHAGGSGQRQRQASSGRATQPPQPPRAAASSLHHQRARRRAAVQLGPVHRLGGRRRASRSVPAVVARTRYSCRDSPAASTSANTSARSSRSSWCCQEVFQLGPHQSGRSSSLTRALDLPSAGSGSSPAPARRQVIHHRHVGQPPRRHHASAAPSPPAPASAGRAGRRCPGPGTPGGWPARRPAPRGSPAARAAAGRRRRSPRRRR